MNHSFRISIHIGLTLNSNKLLGHLMQSVKLIARLCVIWRLLKWNPLGRFSLGEDVATAAAQGFPGRKDKGKEEWEDRCALKKKSNLKYVVCDTQSVPLNHSFNLFTHVNVTELYEDIGAPGKKLYKHF